MEAVIEAQERNPDPEPLGSLRHEVPGPADGVVRAIDNLQIARIARLAGAPLAKGAEVDLLRKQGDAVQQGDALYSVHAEFPADFRFARAQAGQDNGYRIDGVTDNGNGVPNGVSGGQTNHGSRRAR